MAKLSIEHKDKKKKRFLMSKIYLADLKKYRVLHKMLHTEFIRQVQESNTVSLLDFDCACEIFVSDIWDDNDLFCI